MSKENKACSARQKLRSKTKNDLIFLFAILLVLCIAGGVLLLGRTAGDTVAPGQEHLRCQPLAHDGLVENITAENCREVRNMVHAQNPFK